MQAQRSSFFHMTPARREGIWAYIFISPWIVGFIIFTLGPMIVSFFLAFTQYNIIAPPEWVGTGNYQKIFADPLFWQALKVNNCGLIGNNT